MALSGRDDGSLCVTISEFVQPYRAHCELGKLRGTQIPLLARIFAIVDVYDALTSDRPYRPAWSKEKALAHIREQSGTHFDPDVVAAFLGLEEVAPRLAS